MYERSKLPVSEKVGELPVMEKAVVGRSGRERVREDVVDEMGDSAGDFEGR